MDDMAPTQRARIATLLARCRGSKHDWIAATLELAAELYAASLEHRSTHDWSRWCQANIPDLNARQRAGLLRIGAADRGEAEAKLRGLPSTSWEVAGNCFAPRIPKNRKAKVAATPAPAPAPGAATLEPPAPADPLEAAYAGMSDKGRLRFDDAVRVWRERQSKNFESLVDAEVRKRIAEAADAVRAQLAAAQALVRGQERIIASMRDTHVFTKAQFRMLQLCCHPDASASAETRATLLRLLVENEARLVKPQ